MPFTPLIVFIDNSIHQIYKSLDTLNEKYNSIKVFNEEKDGVPFIFDNEIDLLFMNLDLIPQDAVSLTKEIRGKKKGTQPFIIIYSHKQEDFVQELVFNSGADSFINFHNKPAILHLFIKNLLRRRGIIKTEPTNAAIVVDVERYLVFKKELPVQLPKKEFKVFELLYNNPGKFFSKSEIATLIWKDDKIALKRIIDVHIYNIRQLLGKRVIQSQKGRGYSINKKILE